MLLSFKVVCGLVCTTFVNSHCFYPVKKVVFLLACVFLALISEAQVNLANGLMAQYDFTGNANDASPNGNNGVVNGAILRTDRGGNPNACYEFNGVNSNIVVPNSTSFDFPTDRMSISFWFQVCNLPVGTKERYIVSKLDYQSGPANTGWHIFMRKEADSTLMLWYRIVNGNSLNPGVFDQNIATIQPGVWYHAVFMLNATHIQHYLNNVYMGQWPRVNPLTPNTRPLVFGGGVNVWNPLNDLFYGLGRLDDIRIYNRVITAAEVGALYNQIPPATFNQNLTASDNDALCLGLDSLILTANNLPGATYNWSVPGGGTSAGNPLFIADPTNGNSGIYTLTASFEGCNRPPLNVTVDPGPAQLSLTAPAQVCLGSDFTVSAPLVSGAVYTWTAPGAGAPQGSGNVFSVTGSTPAEQGDYSLTYTVNGCIGESNVVSVAMVNQYTVQVFDTICQGQSVFLGGANQTQAGSYQDLYQSVNGCDSLVTTDLFVKPLPQISLGPDQQSCVGSSVTLTAQTNGNVTLWSNNTSGQSITVTTSGSYWVEAVLDGCTARDTAAVTFFLNPPADFSVNTSAQCLTGNSFDFSPNTTYAPGTLFQWSFQGAGTATSALQNPTGITWDAAGSFEISLVVTENNCVSSPSVLSITVFPMPVADFTANPTQGCQPVEVKFFNTTQSFGSYTATWNLGAGFTSADLSPVVIYPDPGSYDITLTVTDVNGCTDTETKPAFITVYPQPVAGFSLQDYDLTTTDPVITVTSEAFQSSQCLYYLNTGEAWNDCSFTASVQGSGVFTITQVVTSGFGCVDSLSREFIIRPLPEIFIPNTFTPNGDFINELFEPSLSWIADFELTIYDRWGGIVFQTDDLFRRWNGKLFNSYEDLPQDSYVYRIRYRAFEETKDYFLEGSVTLVR